MGIHSWREGVLQIQGGGRAGVLPVLQSSDNAVDAVPPERIAFFIFDIFFSRFYDKHIDMQKGEYFAGNHFQ